MSQEHFDFQNPQQPPPEEVNPYAAPQSQVADYAPYQAYDEAILADPWTRLGARFIDGLIMLVGVIPLFIGLFLIDQYFNSAIGLFVVSGLIICGIIAYQAYLISTTGQSIGKKYLNIQIVRLDGSLPGFVYGVLIRSWLVEVINQVSSVIFGGAFGLIDALFIFAADRRCLHDHMAGTRVIVVFPEDL